MAYNYRHQGSHGPSGLDMTDIPGIRSNHGYKNGGQGDNSRSNSPARNVTGKSAEMLSSDLIMKNEDKIRAQIRYVNNLGVSGPFIGFDKTTPAPKSPKIPLGSSSYKMQFSPGKKRDQPLKLTDSSSAIMQSSPSNFSLRHISNGEAMYSRRGVLNNSLDLGRSVKNRISYGKNISFDNKGDDFRFKKNLTTNADRILTKPNSYAHTPNNESNSKFDEIRKQAHNLMSSKPAVSKNDPMAQYKTVDSTYGQENYNANNMRRDPISKPSALVKDPAGMYNSSKLKRTMGMEPSQEVNFAPQIAASSTKVVRSSDRIGQNVSVPNFNDPSYHRQKNFNNYGFDVLTGVRKESPNRIL